jgi:hypothetical protein
MTYSFCAASKIVSIELKILNYGYNGFCCPASTFFISYLPFFHSTPLPPKKSCLTKTLPDLTCNNCCRFHLTVELTACMFYSCAWKDSRCRIGLILGTGTNACYLEDIKARAFHIVAITQHTEHWAPLSTAFGKHLCAIVCNLDPFSISALVYLF